jgi:hypothetical protein
MVAVPAAGRPGLAPKGKGGCDSSRDHAGNGLPNFGADRRREEERGEWDLVKDVESVIKKDGSKTSEKRWVCRFCEKPFQGGPNVIQAHHVHGTGKKKAIQLCKKHPGRRQSKASTGDVHHVAEHRREGDLGGDTNRMPGRRPCSLHGEPGRRIKHDG